MVKQSRAHGEPLLALHNPCSITCSSPLTFLVFPFYLIGTWPGLRSSLVVMTGQILNPLCGLRGMTWSRPDPPSLSPSRALPGALRGNRPPLCNALRFWLTNFAVQYGEVMGTFDERATTSLFENHTWRPSSTVSKEIIINLPTCWRHVPIFDFGSFTHFHTRSSRQKVFPVVGSDTNHNDNLHFTTLLITSHPSSPYYTHVCNTNEKRRKSGSTHWQSPQ
jgi:hypothetical protein